MTQWFSVFQCVWEPPISSGVSGVCGYNVCYFSAYVRGEGSVKNTQFSLHDNRATIMKPEQNAEYISKIRMRLCDDSLARKVTLTCVCQQKNNLAPEISNGSVCNIV